MGFKSDAEILHIYQGLIDQSLPKPDWTHAAHFAAACAMIADPARNAERDMPDIIKSYNLSTGVENTDHDGYHHTITLASLGAARHYGKEDTSLFERVNTVMTSECGQSDWLLAYWSKEALFSPIARHEWVLPDLKTLPFPVRLS